MKIKNVYDIFILPKSEVRYVKDGIEYAGIISKLIGVKELALDISNNTSISISNPTVILPKYPTVKRGKYVMIDGGNIVRITRKTYKGYRDAPVFDGRIVYRWHEETKNYLKYAPLRQDGAVRGYSQYCINRTFETKEEFEEFIFTELI
jgi:hypothetical protein